MSEYVNYYAVQSAASDLDALRTEISGVLSDALVLPNADLFQSLLDEGRDAELTAELSGIAWQKTPRPAWVVVGRSDPDVAADMALLGGIGPVVHIDVQEDSTRWKADILAGGTRWAVMVADTGWGSGWIAAVDEPLLQAGPDGIGDLQAVCAHLGLDPAALRASLLPDGAAKFRELLGVPAPYLFDQRVMARRLSSVRMIHELLPF